MSKRSLDGKKINFYSFLWGRRIAVVEEKAVPKILINSIELIPDYSIYPKI